MKNFFEECLRNVCERRAGRRQGVVHVILGAAREIGRPRYAVICAFLRADALDVAPVLGVCVRLKPAAAKVDFL